MGSVGLVPISRCYCGVEIYTDQQVHHWHYAEPHEVLADDFAAFYR